MYPEERQKIHAGERLALVEAFGQGHAFAERSQDRGEAEDEDGECKFSF